MNAYVIYGMIAVLLLGLEIIYFKIAEKCNIIDKPNERSSHSTIVLRGGGVIFPIAVLLWMFAGLASRSFMFAYIAQYMPFVLAVVLVATVSFIDDVRSLPDSVRLIAQFTGMLLMLWSLYLFGRSNGLFHDTNLLIMAVFVVCALIVCVGATNIVNFMDGINGITGGYSAVVLASLLMANNGADKTLIIIMLLADVVFCFFNFRPRGKAKCFAGDVGSISLAFIMLFLIGQVIVKTQDVTWLIFLLVYGVDGVLTICHRILLHENLGEAHRKHAYQLMANELKMSHPLVSCIYMGMQLAISLGFIYLCPNTILAHWIYLICALVILAVAYVLFKKKYYHLHEEYLAGLNESR